MRRNLSLFCLLFAWLCANGALWNLVQVVAWAKMFHDYSQVMPAAAALQRTFDGSEPCKLCRISQTAEETARRQLPQETSTGGGPEKLLFVSECAPAVIVPAAELAWPGIANDTGLTRTETVPVPPPRA